MKILHITPFFPPSIVGGMETFISNLVRALQERGHQNYVHASYLAERGPELADYHGAVIHRTNFMNAVTGNQLADIIIAKKKLRETKKNFLPDITVTHIGGLVAILELSTPEPEIPLVTVAYDLPPSGEGSPTLQKLFNKSRRVIAISNARLNDVNFIAPESAPRSQVIYSSRPARTFPGGIPKSTHPTVIMTGRLVATKGFDLAIEAFQTVRREIPDAKLILVGDGPLFLSLQEQVKSLGLEEAVRITGYLSDEELSRIYSEAWISLAPSRHSESFGLVALEGMQASLPVIASATGGLVEVVENEKTGLLIPRDDSNALAQAIIRLCKDKSLAEEMGKNGFERANKLFNWQDCVSKYEKTLEEAVKS